MRVQFGGGVAYGSNYGTARVYTRASCPSRARGSRDGARGAREAPEAFCTLLSGKYETPAYLFNASNIFNVPLPTVADAGLGQRFPLMPAVISVMSCKLADLFISYAARSADNI